MLNRLFVEGRPGLGLGQNARVSLFERKLGTENVVKLFLPKSTGAFHAELAFPIVHVGGKVNRNNGVEFRQVQTHTRPSSSSFHLEPHFSTGVILD